MNATKLLPTGALLLTGLIYYDVITEVIFHFSAMPDLAQAFEVGTWTFHGLQVAAIALYYFSNRAFRGKGYWILLTYPALIIASGNLLSAVAIGVYLIASLGLGMALLRLFNIQLAHAQYHVFASTLTGGLVLSYLSWCCAFFPINFRISYWGFFLLLAILSARSIWAYFRSNIEILRLSIWPQEILYLLVFFIPLFIWSLLPILGFDEMMYYMYVPKQILVHGQFDYSPDYVLGYYHSVSIIGHNTILLLLGGENAVRIFNFIAIIGASAIAISLVRRHYSVAASRFCALIFATSPLVFTELSGIIYAEPVAVAGTGFLLIVFFEQWQGKLDYKTLIYLFLMFGLIYTIRVLPVFAIIPLVFLLAYQEVRIGRGVWPTATMFFFAGLCTFLPIIPPALNSYLDTGSPMFPVYNHLFKSPFFTNENWNQLLFQNMHPFSWDFLRHLTLFGDHPMYYGAKFGFGFAFYMLAAVALASLAIADIRLKLLGFWAITSFVMYNYFAWQHRYIFVFYPVLAVFTSIGATEMIRSFYSDRELKRNILYGFMAIPMLLSFWFAKISYDDYRKNFPWSDAFIEEPKIPFLDAERKAFTLINKKYPKETRAFICWGPFLYLADFNIEMCEWYNFTTMVKFREEQKPKQKKERFLYEKARYLFSEKKFDLLIFNADRDVTFLEAGLIQLDFEAPPFRVYIPSKKYWSLYQADQGKSKHRRGHNK